MVAALAGVIHDRQGANGGEHNRSDDNCKRGFHCDLANAGQPAKFPSFKLNRGWGFFGPLVAADKPPDHSALASRNSSASFATLAAIRCLAHLLVWVQTRPVEYKGTRYTLRAGIERDQWYVSIHPAGVEMKGKVVTGSRGDAESRARDMIGDWLKKDPMQEPKSD
jgi:hypothetical protein